MATKKLSLREASTAVVSANMVDAEEALEQARINIESITARAGALQPWLQVKRLDTEKVMTATMAWNDVRALRNSAEEFRKQVCAPFLKPKQEIDRRYKPLTAALEQFEHHLQNLLAMYQTEERAKSLKEAEKTAVRAEKLGNEQLAEDIRTQAATVPILLGVQSFEKTRVRVLSVKALCAAIGRGEAAEDLVEVRMPALNALLKTGAKLPAGCETYEDTVLR